MILNGLYIYIFTYHAFTLFKILELLETWSFFLQTYAKKFPIIKKNFTLTTFKTIKERKTEINQFAYQFVLINVSNFWGQRLAIMQTFIHSCLLSHTFRSWTIHVYKFSWANLIEHISSLCTFKKKNCILTSLKKGTSKANALKNFHHTQSFTNDY
jgi:hypothetical protein